MKLLGHAVISCFLRAFLDTVEKYLFEFDYVNPFKMLMEEGLVSCIIIIVICVIDHSQLEIKLNKTKESQKYEYYIINCFICILLVFKWI